MYDYRTDDLLTPLPQGSEIPPLDQLPPGTTRFIDVTVYDVPAPQEQEEDDAGIIQGERTSIPDEQGHSPPLAPPSTRPLRPRSRLHHARRPHLLLVVLLVVCVGSAIGLALVALVPLFAASATITIVPVARQVSVTTQVSIVASGTPDVTRGQLAGRPLPALTMSQQGSAPTTGRAHQDARVAHGRITFYNAATSAQTVPAGTLLTGTDGVQVVTEQDAVIPAAVLPTDGQATILAHAVQVGPAGNMQADDIYGACCRLNVFAVNSAFVGGAQARDYQTVTQHDLDQVTTTLKASLDQSIQAALNTQAHADETVPTPPACTVKAVPDHQPGDEAAQVHLLLTESCTGLAYSTHAYQQILAQRVEQAAHTHLGEGYQPQTDPTATVLHTASQGQGMMLDVRVSQSYGYQFTAEQQAHIKALVAGKGKTEATSTVLGVPGVQSVSLSIGSGSTVLPSDTSRIHLAFLVMEAS